MSPRLGRRTQSKTLALQQLAMRSWFPQFIYERGGNCGTWTGTLKPSDDSPEYLIYLEYIVGTSPKVQILYPEITPDTPHMYRSDGALCLYYPGDGDWSSEMLIAYRIMPWIVEWLKYYEIWCTTDKWFGPEAPHSGKK